MGYDLVFLKCQRNVSIAEEVENSAAVFCPTNWVDGFEKDLA
jgi:hypothetical protein